MMRIDLRFAGELQKRLTDELNEAHRNLGSGTSILRDDAAATGMGMARQVGKIEGIKAALTLLKQVHEELTEKADK